jgi:hypothetical protein
MKRREFIGLLACATAWVSGVRAQEPRQVIDILSSFGSSLFAEVTMPTFSQGLKDAGFVEGRNISIESRLADDYDPQPRGGALFDHFVSLGEHQNWDLKGISGLEIDHQLYLSALLDWEVSRLGAIKRQQINIVERII